jgi:hypothetical protein
VNLRITVAKEIAPIIIQGSFKRFKPHFLATDIRYKTLFSQKVLALTGYFSFLSKTITVVTRRNMAIQ